MNSIFAGLEIARKSLTTQQRALEVTGHNVANVNTPGYSRQTAYLVTTAPSPDPSANKVNYGAGQVGTGVTVASIQRARLDYIDRQIWEENCTLGEYEQRSSMLQKLEIIFNEPSDSGLRSVVDKFYESLHELSKRPEDMDVRGVVRQRAVAMTSFFNMMSDQLTEMEGDFQFTVEEKVKDANEISTKIAQLNGQIKQIRAAGDTPNDLYDQRDLLTEQLSKLMDIRTNYDAFGQVFISVGGTAVVCGDQALTLKAETDFGGKNEPGMYVDGSKRLLLRWQETGNEVKLQSGEFKGLLDLYNYGDGTHKSVKYYLQEINKIAADIIKRVNDQHSQGYTFASINSGTTQMTNVNFFQPLSETEQSYAALKFKVNEDILSGDEDGGGLWNIAAAAAPGMQGDGENALKMAETRNNPTSFDSNWTQDDFLRNFIAALGVDGQESERVAENQSVLLEQLQYSRDEISGVSLDEEAMSMIKYQHAFNAASRMITVVDGMIDLIVNRLGLVGR